MDVLCQGEMEGVGWWGYIRSLRIEDIVFVVRGGECHHPSDYDDDNTDHDHDDFAGMNLSSLCCWACRGNHAP